MIVLARRLRYVWNVSEAIGNGSLTTLPEEYRVYQAE